MSTMMRIGEPPVAPRGGFALWALGFRPFYLLGTAYAALSVLVWALQYGGVLGVAPVRGPAWHAYEMIFGFALAIVVGFLFTAVPNWAQRRTPTGALLAAIVALWVAGRVLVYTPFPVAAAVVNVAFPLAAAVGIAVPLVASANRRNYFFVALLVAAAAASLVVHLASLGVIALPERVGLQAGLDLVLLAITVVAGRVVPMFTNNGVPEAGAERKVGVERAAIFTTVVLLAADLLGWRGSWMAFVCFAALLAHAHRFVLWRPWRTWANPMVWILHAAYAWILVHLLLRLLALGDIVPAPLATHALTVGAIGGMTLGMMTRTARGHTGLSLKAGGVEVAAYALVMAAALVRVGVPLVTPGAYVPSVMVAGLLWFAAFATYFVGYWPILTRPRVDGRPG